MKKILSLVLASAMVASSLAGCGSSKTAETQAPTTQAPAESAAPEGSDAATEAPAETVVAGAIEDGAESVSYTHLDVYKRQAISGAFYAYHGLLFWKRRNPQMTRTVCRQTLNTDPNIDTGS